MQIQRLIRDLLQDVDTYTTNYDRSRPEPTSENSLGLRCGDILFHRRLNAVHVVTSIDNSLYSIINLTTGTLATFNSERNMTKEEFDKNYILLAGKSLRGYIGRIFRWKQTSAKLLRQENCDVLLYCGKDKEKTVYTHRCLLEENIRLFGTGFRHNHYKKPHEYYEIEVAEEDFPYIREMIKFMHGNAIRTPEETFHELLRVVNYFDHDLLIEFCLKILPLKLTLQNLPNYLKLWKSYTPAALAIIYDFMADNWEEIIKNHYALYESLDKKQTAEFLSHMAARSKSTRITVQSTPVSTTTTQNAPLMTTTQNTTITHDKPSTSDDNPNPAKKQKT